MTPTDHVHTGQTHCVSAICSAAAEDAFAFVADTRHLGGWALGCWDALVGSDGTARGTSLFDGEPTFVRIDQDHTHLAVDFHVGDDPAALVRRISVRVVPGDELGGPAATCLVILTAWRVSSMDNERWHRLVVTHEAEILLLRHRIETSAG